MTDAEGRPDKSELLAAFDGVVKREQEKAMERRAAPVARRTHVIVVVLCVLSWGGLAYTWLAKPAWLFLPDAGARLTPQEQETRLRFGMYLERERVLDFRATYHRLPSRLAEAGDVEPGIEYQASGDSSFVVSAMVRDSLLTLNESQKPDELLRPTGIVLPRPR
jgi:hypothetical protein